MIKRRLYLLILALSAAGCIWLAVNYSSGTALADNCPDVCWFKNITGIPCPSCGSTRSGVALLHGDWRYSLSINPMGIGLVAMMTLFPIWIIIDIAQRKNSFLNFYNRAEIIIRNRWIAIPLAFLVLVNWVWNIYKHV